MRYLVSSAEMKQYDANTSEKFKVSPMVLMERAALALAEEVRRLAGGNGKVLFVCGNGNNGADGLAAARILLLWHIPTDIVWVGDRDKATTSCKKQFKTLKEYNFHTYDAIPDGKAYDIIVDAIFGVGLSHDVTGFLAELVGKMNEMPGLKVAADLPTGVSADGGAVLGVAFKADVTVTFAFPKAGLFLYPGSEYAGEVLVRDVGITEESFCGNIPKIRALEMSDLKNLPERKSHSNKGTYGKMLLIAGSHGCAGAAVLAAKAACAAGCGLVRIFTPEENRVILQTAVPEAVLTVYEDTAGEKDIEKMLSEALQWADAAACGPGLGTGDIAAQIVKQIICETAVPTVLDADALNIIARDRLMLGYAGAELILTPHPGEMARLTGESTEDICGHLMETAEAFATGQNVICVLKDAHTVISIPNRENYVNLSGNHGMATAGSGDVLTGIIASLLAQGLDGGDAAAYGAYLHGLAGDGAKEETGFRGLTASDLISGLRRLFAKEAL